MPDLQPWPQAPPETQPSMASLVTGIIDDAQKLIRQELELAKREISLEWDKAKTAAVSFAGGFLVAFFSGVMLCLMSVYLLHELAGLRLWLSYLIVGGVLGTVGRGLFLFGKTKADDVNVIPPETAETLKENAQWIQNRT